MFHLMISLEIILDEVEFHVVNDKSTNVFIPTETPEVNSPHCAQLLMMP